MRKILGVGTVFFIIAILLCSAITVPALKKAVVNEKQDEIKENTVENKFEKLLDKYEDDLEEINKYFENYFEKINQGGIEAKIALLKAKLFGILPKDLQSKLKEIESEFNDIFNEKVIPLSGGKNDYKVKHYWKGWWIFEYIYLIKHTLWLDHHNTNLLKEYGSLGLFAVFLLLSAVAPGIGTAASIALAGYILQKGLDERIDDWDHGNGVKFTFKDYTSNGVNTIDEVKVEPQ